MAAQFEVAGGDFFRRVRLVMVFLTTCLSEESHFSPQKRSYRIFQKKKDLCKATTIASMHKDLRLGVWTSIIRQNQLDPITFRKQAIGFIN